MGLDVEHLIKYSEPADSPPRRILLSYDAANKHTVMLLNEMFPQLLHYVDLFNDNKFVHRDADPNMLVLTASPEIPELEEIECDQKTFELSPYTLVTDGKKLAIPTEEINHTDGEKASKKDSAKENPKLWATLGVVITGKQFLNDKISAAFVLSKDTPTPFVADRYGDTYNDSFLKEPRVIEQVPSTIFTAINSILDCGRKLYKEERYNVAVVKFRKAFHYCHKYYPDNLTDDELAILTSLKIKSLLNLSLACLKSNDLSRAIECADFLLDMPEVASDPVVQSKAYFRRGSAYLAMGDPVAALQDFELAQSIKPDPATTQQIALCKATNRRKNASLREHMSQKFKEERF